MLSYQALPALHHRVQVAPGDRFKRVSDIVAATILLLLALPLFAIIACLVALDGGPVFFAHWRVGRNGVPFPCFKFRTMMMGADHCLAEYLELHPEAKHEWQGAHKLMYDPRITGIGRVLRALSLDELPQLWNVLRGEMSLVGPRPVTQAEINAHYRDAAETCLSVRPGLTGPWQVMGRNALTYEARVSLDVAYVRSRSFVRDIVILAKTFGAVVEGSGQ